MYVIRTILTSNNLITNQDDLYNAETFSRQPPSHKKKLNFKEDTFVMRDPFTPRATLPGQSFNKSPWSGANILVIGGTCRYGLVLPLISQYHYDVKCRLKICQKADKAKDFSAICK